MVFFFLGKRKRKLEESEKGGIPVVFLGGSLERRLQRVVRLGLRDFFRGNGERFLMLGLRDFFQARGERYF